MLKVDPVLIANYHPGPLKHVNHEAVEGSMIPWEIYGKPNGMPTKVFVMGFRCFPDFVSDRGRAEERSIRTGGS